MIPNNRTYDEDPSRIGFLADKQWTMCQDSILERENQEQLCISPKIITMKSQRKDRTYQELPWAEI